MHGDLAVTSGLGILAISIFIIALLLIRAASLETDKKIRTAIICTLVGFLGMGGVFVILLLRNVPSWLEDAISVANMVILVLLYASFLYTFLEPTPLSDKEKRILVAASMLLSLYLPYAHAIPVLYGLVYRLRQRP